MPAKRTRAPRTCVVCAQTFLIKPSDLEKSRGAGTFCSRQCMTDSAGVTLSDRFYRQCQVADGCWDWQGAIDGKGYGALTFHGRQFRAHQVAWEIATGAPVPDGKIIGHTCDRPICVRHDDTGVYEVAGVLYERHGHLWLATVAANSADMVQKGRSLTGDRSPSRIHSGRLARGDQNGARQHPERLLRGEHVNTAKLKASQVLEIRERRAAGESSKSLALAFGVHQNLIWMIHRRLVWKHLT